MLNVLTPKGREAEEAARTAILKLSTAEVSFAWFPQHNFYPIDGFRIEGNAVTGIFEGKTRQAAYDNGAIVYNQKRYEDYLITAQKLDQGTDMAKQMRVDFLLYVYLTFSNHILCFKIWDDAAESPAPFKRMNSRTQAGVNGGSVVRENAYIPIREAQVIVMG